MLLFSLLVFVALASADDYTGAIFPIAAGSLGSISVNWGGSRSSGRRCHAGIDLYTTGAKRVVAVADGVVTGIMRGWYS
jgi:murein DD-endopeptidase MepM/ murein hydrolase activator NlpD